MTVLERSLGGCDFASIPENVYALVTRHTYAIARSIILFKLDFTSRSSCNRLGHQQREIFLPSECIAEKEKQKQLARLYPKPPLAGRRTTRRQRPLALAIVPA